MDMLSTLPKYSYQYTPINNGGVGLGLDTKKDFDEDREKRIELYALRWEQGHECISGKPLCEGAVEEWYAWRKFYMR